MTTNEIPRDDETITFRGEQMTLSGAQLLEAIDFLAPDRDRDQLESELTFQRGEGHAGNGMYCWLTECPEEGAFFVDGSTAVPQPSAQADARHGLTHAARDVLAERRRQIEQEGWTPAHDDAHSTGDMALAAACYAVADNENYPLAEPPDLWPWNLDWWKPTDERRNLVKAGALILAEIERLDRAASQAGGSQ